MEQKRRGRKKTKTVFRGGVIMSEDAPKPMEALYTDPVAHVFETPEHAVEFIEYSRYREAVRLCQVNKSFAAICRMKVVQNALKRKEQEESLFSFLTHRGTGGAALSPTLEWDGQPIAEPLNGIVDGGIDILRAGGVREELLVDLEAAFDVTEDPNQAPDMDFVMITFMNILRYPKATLHETGFAFDIAPEDHPLDVEAAGLFGWSPTRVIEGTDRPVIGPGEVTQLVTIMIKAHDPPNDEMPNVVDGDIYIQWSKWDKYFRRGMSKKVAAFEGVWK